MIEYIWRTEKNHECYRLGITSLFLQYTNLFNSKQFLIRIINRAFVIKDGKFKTWIIPTKKIS